MRTLALQRTYPLPPRELMEVMLDPALDAFLTGRLPDLQSRTVMATRRNGELVERQVRCIPHPRIPDAARKVVKPEMVTWVEDAHFDLARGVVDVAIIPVGFRDVFRFKGQVRVAPEGDGSVRRMSGELEIRIPVVGRLVEDYLVNLIRSNMEAEAEALHLFISEGRPRA